MNFIQFHSNGYQADLIPLAFVGNYWLWVRKVGCTKPSKQQVISISGPLAGLHPVLLLFVCVNRGGWGCGRWTSTELDNCATHCSALHHKPFFLRLNLCHGNDWAQWTVAKGDTNILGSVYTTIRNTVTTYLNRNPKQQLKTWRTPPYHKGSQTNSTTNSC